MKPPQESPDFPNAFYRVTVKGLCVRGGKVLLVHDFTGRSDTDPSPEWELPGGGLDFGESFEDALRREVKEEMGLEIAWIEAAPTYVWTVKHGSGKGMEWYWICSVLFRFDVENLNFTPSEECREIRFFSQEELQADYDNLSLQAKPLAHRFDPADFTERYPSPQDHTSKSATASEPAVRRGWGEGTERANQKMNPL